MFDSHCHLDDDAYDADRVEVIERARSAGVRGIFIPGYTPSEWQTLPSLCAQDPLLCFGLGIHPWYVKDLSERELAAALDALPVQLSESGACAVGECGLDAKHARREGASLELQSEVLSAHLTVARRLQLPIVLHCVDAHERLLGLLERQGPLARGGVLHSYSGSAELVPRYARLNLSFSFAGVLTRAEAQRPKLALRAVPLDRLLVESDGPDQAARDLPTRRSEPVHVGHLLQTMAGLRDEPYESLVRETTINALTLFGRH